MNLKKFININWYMERKPYAAHTSYDLYYLDICRELFTIIDNLADEYDDVPELDDEDCREMAYVFTAYFEDQVNEIGFWPSLIALHKTHFGKRLPFFDAALLQQQEEDCEDILPADIHYLAYITYLNLRTDEEEKTIVFFKKPFFIELANRVFDYLDNKEEVLTTDFYDHFLIPAEDYIDFKKQTDWFTFYSYLTGIEFTRLLENHEWRLEKKNTDASFMPMMMYAERDRLLFEVPSLLTAFLPLDILAGAIRCSDSKKEEIMKLKWRSHGIFHVQQETATHYRFLHTSTLEEFTVLKNSFDKPLDSKREEYWITTVAGWNNDYYVSGLCLPSPYKGEEIYHRNIEMQHSFQKHFPSYRKHIEETAVSYREKAVKFFSNDLVVFKTRNQLQEKLNEFNLWYFDTVADKTKLAKETKPVLFRVPEEWSAVRDIALFIPPVDGLQFITKHKQLLHILQTPKPDKVSLEEMQEVLPMLFDDSVGAEYWYYLKKNFEIPNLSLFMKCPADNDEDFDALLRIYRAPDFSPLKLPRFTTFTSERISPETVRKIFSKKEE